VVADLREKIRDLSFETQLLTFLVCTQTEGYDESLYPPSLSNQPALSAEEWAGGANEEPHLLSVDPEQNLFGAEPVIIEKAKPVMVTRSPGGKRRL